VRETPWAVSRRSIAAVRAIAQTAGATREPPAMAATSHGSLTGRVGPVRADDGVPHGVGVVRRPREWVGIRAALPSEVPRRAPGSLRADRRFTKRSTRPGTLARNLARTAAGLTV